jgi:hypothetical protein
MNSKYIGIDARTIKCSCDNPNCVEGGISFGDDYLFFHFLDVDMSMPFLYTQKRRAMRLDNKTRNELISELKKLKLPK